MPLTAYTCHHCVTQKPNCGRAEAPDWHDYFGISIKMTNQKRFLKNL